MRRVIIESPYAGDVEENLRYLRAAMTDCLRRGEAPFASHALYTQPGVLNDDDPTERELGITAGFAWRETAAATVFYLDRGVSHGMVRGLWDAAELRRQRSGAGHRLEVRWLEGWPKKPPSHEGDDPEGFIAMVKRIAVEILADWRSW